MLGTRNAWEMVQELARGSESCQHSDERKPHQRDSSWCQPQRHSFPQGREWITPELCTKQESVLAQAVLPQQRTITWIWASHSAMGTSTLLHSSQGEHSLRCSLKACCKSLPPGNILVSPETLLPLSWCNHFQLVEETAAVGSITK